MVPIVDTGDPLSACGVVEDQPCGSEVCAFGVRRVVEALPRMRPRVRSEWQSSSVLCEWKISSASEEVHRQFACFGTQENKHTVSHELSSKSSAREQRKSACLVSKETNAWYEGSLQDLSKVRASVATHRALLLSRLFAPCRLLPSLFHGGCVGFGGEMVFATQTTHPPIRLLDIVSSTGGRSSNGKCGSVQAPVAVEGSFTGSSGICRML